MAWLSACADLVTMDQRNIRKTDGCRKPMSKKVSEALMTLRVTTWVDHLDLF